VVLRGGGGGRSYDLLCLEGLSRALLTFLYPDTDRAPQYVAVEPASGPRHRLTIKPEVRTLASTHRHNRTRPQR
jgi:hypothetical protein